GSDTSRTLTLDSNVDAVEVTAFSSITSPSSRGSTWYRTSNPPCKSKPRLTSFKTSFNVSPIVVNNTTIIIIAMSILFDFFFTYTPLVLNNAFIITLLNLNINRKSNQKTD